MADEPDLFEAAHHLARRYVQDGLMDAGAHGLDDG